jgi:hypothetical protein
MSCRLFPITVIGNGIEATAIIGNAYLKMMVHGLERNKDIMLRFHHKRLRES